MKILLLGYGRMGRAIEGVAVGRGHDIVGRIGRDEPVADPLWQAADVAIEFTHPRSAPQRISECFSHKLPVVCGTTGWPDALQTQKARSAQGGHKLLWSPNFSVGVHAMLKAVAAAAEVLGRDPAYDVSVKEVHHTGKRDSPSGTAIAVADYVELYGESFENVPIHSIRKDEVFGNHELEFRGPCDTLRIIHSATSRAGFSHGAVRAAEWLNAFNGPVDRTFGMDDFCTT
jgi:4-hydroxy-tetrahydrodipicolinate reductase